MSGIEITNKTAAKPIRPLGEWIQDYHYSAEYRSLISRFSGRAGAMTSVEEVSMLYAIIQYLKPRVTLEIGTFFAHTTLIMAKAIVDGDFEGKLVTLDPFGGHRVPGIIAAWPQALRQVTDGRDWNSMQYFLELETLGIPKGAASPIGVVFVDGHHNFEYALYDIIRSADHVMPGGAIVVDNLEQEGPKRAVTEFLQWNPGWQFFYEGSLYASGITTSVIEAKQGCWGVLISPQGLLVASSVTKILKRGLSYQPLKGLTFNVIAASHPGTLHYNFFYCAVPYDFHITGKGMLDSRSSQQCRIAADQFGPVTSLFSEPLKFSIESPEMNLYYELELRFENSGHRTAQAYLLLDAEENVTLIPC